MAGKLFALTLVLDDLMGQATAGVYKLVCVDGPGRSGVCLAGCLEAMIMNASLSLAPLSLAPIRGWQHPMHVTQPLQSVALNCRAEQSVGSP